MDELVARVFSTKRRKPVECGVERRDTLGRGRFDRTRCRRRISIQLDSVPNVGGGSARNKRRLYLLATAVVWNWQNGDSNYEYNETIRQQEDRDGKGKVLHYEFLLIDVLEPSRRWTFI